MTRSIAASFGLVLLVLLLSTPFIVSAQGAGGYRPQGPTESRFDFPGIDRIVPQCTGDYLVGDSGERACTFCDFMTLAQNLLNFALFLAIVTAGALFAYAGWLYATRAMNTANVGKAHSIFINVVIGLVLVMGAYVIIDTIMKVLSGGDFFSTWTDLCPGSGGSGFGGAGSDAYSSSRIRP